ncbi:MAG: hypothetical protein MJ200_05070 [Mycoplasmoidaceae bacterium]|nr:hypothetical protein [Mycoplasmoidaceae bacterium]
MTNDKRKEFYDNLMKDKKTQEIYNEFYNNLKQIASKTSDAKTKEALEKLIDELDKE